MGLSWTSQLHGCLGVAAPEEQRAQWEVPTHEGLEKEQGALSWTTCPGSWDVWNVLLSDAAKLVAAFRQTPRAVFCVCSCSLLSKMSGD